MVTAWDKDLENQIKLLNPQEIVHLNNEIAVYLATNESVLFDIGGKEPAKYAGNVTKYLKTIGKEYRAEFVNHITEAKGKGFEWGAKLLNASPNQELVNFIVAVIQGDTEDDKKLKANLNPDNIKDDYLDDEIQRLIDGI